MGAGGTCVEERGRRLEAVSVCGWDSFGCPQLASLVTDSIVSFYLKKQLVLTVMR